MRGLAPSLLLPVSLAVGLSAMTGCAAATQGAATPPTRTLATRLGSVDPSPLEVALPRLDDLPDVLRPPPAREPPRPEPTDPLEAAFEVSGARCPNEMALVGDRVCVDRWEAIVVEPRGGAEQAVSPYHPLDDHPGPFRAVSKPNVVPQGYISGTVAERACRASGKRLCKASEWELACRGPSGSAFPYGRDRKRGVCNDDVREVHPVVEASRAAGLDRERYWLEGMNLPAINQLDQSVTPTGERAECRTEDGIYDMVGNLHEWVDDPGGTFRGGYYMDTSHNGEGCAYQTTGHAVGYHDYSTGFRCCMEPYDAE